MTSPSITCPVCGMTSYHPEDIRQGYCGRCCWYTSCAKCWPVSRNVVIGYDEIIAVGLAEHERRQRERRRAALVPSWRQRFLHHFGFGL